MMSDRAPLARAVLSRLETEHDGAKDSLGGLPLFTAAPPREKTKPSEIELAIANLDIDTLSARNALDLLYDLKAYCDFNASKC